MRRSVLERKAFDKDFVTEMAREAEIPEEDREQVADYVEAQIKGLHEGNVIRFRLKPEDLQGVDHE